MRIVCGIHFPSIGSKHFNMSSKRKEYKVDDRATKAALFFLACEANPATRLSIPAATRAKGYSDVDAMNRILIQQVRRESPKNKAENSPRPETVAAAAMLALLNKTNAVGSVLARISPIPEVSSAASGGAAGNLPSPQRKTRKTCNQEQIEKQNGQKQKALHAQAHACATTLVAEERGKEKENQRTTTQVIEQVEGDFRARGFGVTLNKVPINHRYVRINMIGTFPLV